MARIRELTRADIPSVVDLLAGESFRGSDDPAGSWRRFAELSLGRDILYLAEEDSVVSGLVCFYPEPIFANGGYVRFLFVRPDMRRRGIGRQLLGFVERKVLRKTPDMYFCVPSDNETGIKFLQTMGYIKDSEISASPTVPHRWSIMRKNLESIARSRRAAGES